MAQGEEVYLIVLKRSCRLRFFEIKKMTKLEEIRILEEEMEDAQYGMRVNCGTDGYEEYWEKFLEAEEKFKKLKEKKR